MRGEVRKMKARCLLKNNNNKINKSIENWVAKTSHNKLVSKEAIELFQQK